MNVRNWIYACIAAICLAGAGGAMASTTKIGVLCQPDFPKVGAPSDPLYLAELLKNAGYEPVMLSANDLADSKTLDPKAIPLVVLPYGPLFPADAASNWKRYLHEGGGFFSTGGYAFDEALWRKDGKWLTWSQLIAEDPRYIVNGRFDGSDGWAVEGDKNAAHFGPDPNRNGEPGLVLGYPWETSYKTGGRETSVTVKQTIAAPPAGCYEISFNHYSRWTKGAVASQGFDLSLVRFGPHTEGLAGFCVRMNTLDSAGKLIKEYDLYSVGAWEEVPFGPAVKRFDITPETSRIEISLSYDKLAGCVGVSDVRLYRWPEAHAMNTHWGKDIDATALEPGAIGAFDCSFPLRHVDRAVADADQLVVPGNVELKGPFEGLVAETVNYGNTRLMPVMQALDRYGRPRGALGAIVYNGDRHDYKNSAWALWGVSNADIFARGNSEMAGVFTDVIDRLVNKVYLTRPQTDLPCYRDFKGPIKIGISAVNGGDADRQAHAKIEVIDESGRAVYTGEGDTLLRAGGSFDFNWSFKPGQGSTRWVLPDGCQPGRRRQAIRSHAGGVLRVGRKARGQWPPIYPHQ